MITLDHILDIGIAEQFIQYLGNLFLLYINRNFSIHIYLVVIYKQIRRLFLYFRENFV